MSVPLEQPTLNIRLRRGVVPTTEVGFSIEVEGSRMVLRGSGISGWADASLGQADCLLQGLPACESAVSPEEVVETLFLFLLTRNGRTPLHASGFMLGDQAVILAGPSGSGKSTLALAAARHGLPVLSDDTIFIQTNPVFRIWGQGGPIHVLPEDTPDGSGRRRMRNGRLKLAVCPTRPSDQPHHAGRAQLMLLCRGERLDLVPASADRARQRLVSLEPGFDLLRRETEEAVEVLLANCETWQLTLSCDPDMAVDLLCRRLAGAPQGDSGPGVRGIAGSN